MTCDAYYNFREGGKLFDAPDDTNLGLHPNCGEPTICHSGGKGFQFLIEGQEWFAVSTTHPDRVLPSSQPTAAPTAVPTTASPTIRPTLSPTTVPTTMPTTPFPTAAPTAVPTVAPSSAPTATPSVAPTVTPSAAPTSMPTKEYCSTLTWGECRRAMQCQWFRREAFNFDDEEFCRPATCSSYPKKHCRREPGCAWSQQDMKC